MTDDEYWNQGIVALDKNYTTVEEIIALFPDEIRKPVEKMMAGKVGEQFFEAPASTRREFHCAFPSGLVAHSLTVVSYAVKLAETLSPGRWPKWKVMFCALFHDLGKAGMSGAPHYTQNTERWKRERGEYYNFFPGMPTSEKGLFILQEAGVVLDPEMFLSIRLSDGMGPVENKPYSFREPPLALIIHWADHWSTVQEKEANV